MAENIAIRACPLVGKRHHGAGNRVLGIRLRRPPTLQVIPNAFAGQLLDDELRHEPPSVKTDVHNKPVSLYLHQIEPMELREAPQTHVGDVHIAHPPIRGLMNSPAIVLYPLPIPSRK